MKWFAACACGLLAGLAFGQSPPGKPAFEVASIRATDPNPASPMFIGMSADGAMVKYTNITLRDCIRGAFRARDFQIVGPDWMTKARFEIDAKLPSAASMTGIQFVTDDKRRKLAVPVNLNKYSLLPEHLRTD